MFKKAKLFNERANILGILKTVTPAEVKQLGRKVFLFTKSMEDPPLRNFISGGFGQILSLERAD